MPMFLLKFLKPKSVAWTEAAIILLVVVYAWNQHERLKTQRSELETVRVSLQNPKVVEKIRTITVQGPTRTITKIVERPTGEKETTIDETKGPETETVEAKTEKTPVPLNALLPRLRTDRWLLSFGLNRLSGDFDGKMILAGYGWRNRFDLQAGVIEKDGTSPWLMATVRF